MIFDKANGQHRVVIQSVIPQLNDGQYSIKRTLGEVVKVSAQIFTDGHELIQARLCYRTIGEQKWTKIIMKDEGKSVWVASFPIKKLKNHEYTIEAWIDESQGWQRTIELKVYDDQSIEQELKLGIQYLGNAAKHATGKDQQQLLRFMEILDNPDKAVQAKQIVLSKELNQLLLSYSSSQFVTTYPKILLVKVARKKAMFSTWYEFFPRSTSETPFAHGTFKDAEKLLSGIAKMGFDVLYLPPIHPIGETARKGKNNQLNADLDEPGSPWAIGNKEGGHTAVHPQLGTLKDFKQFVKKAKKLGIEIAMDFAIQCSPEHPWVEEHPDWFKKRPDGSIQHAQNPPKEYEDIYPIYFETADWQNLWAALKGVLEFWIDKGVTIFRADNPHLKPFAFWEWCIDEIQKEHPDVLFLAEAFTRPYAMEHLAKVGFSQSYTYFTWKVSKTEIQNYLLELTQGEKREYFRPNFWPTTPDILPYHLHNAHPPAFHQRFFLAALLSASYGIYGAAFHEYENTPNINGAEEYFDSEKYEIKYYKWDKPSPFKKRIAQINQIRRENPALQQTFDLTFVQTNNDQVLAFVKKTADLSNIIFVVINLDPYNKQAAFCQFPYQAIGLSKGDSIQLEELLDNETIVWNQEEHFVELDSDKNLVKIFRVALFNNH